MKKFEYEMLSIANGTDGAQFISVLNRYGNEHWEVISMTPSSGRDHFNILMKREIMDENYIDTK